MNDSFDEIYVEDSDVAVEVPVDRLSQLARLKVALQHKARHLSRRVDARVRAARAVYDHVPLIEEREDSRKLRLNGAAIRLYLPAMIIRPVVLNCDLDVSHLKFEI